MLRRGSFLFLCFWLTVLSRTLAAEPDRKGVAAAQDCFKAIAAGDTSTMKDFYAPKVRLAAGSEFLKQKWGLSADRSRDLVVERDRLMATYKKLLVKVGVKRWQTLFRQIPPKRILITVVREADDPIHGVRPGDIQLAVQTRADSDDTLFWFLRRTKNSKWLIFAEVTDF